MSLNLVLRDRTLMIILLCKFLMLPCSIWECQSIFMSIRGWETKVHFTKMSQLSLQRIYFRKWGRKYFTVTINIEWVRTYKFNILHEQNTVVKMKWLGCYKLDFPIVGGDPKIRAKNRHKIQQLSYVNIRSREELYCVDLFTTSSSDFPIDIFFKSYIFIIPKKTH